MGRFKIDLGELAFLSEACIPPSPIARAMFWQRLINDIYYEMTDNERAHFFEWITRLPRFDKNNEDCQWFYARFNPSNQYIVKCFYEGKAQEVEGFKKDDRYWTSMTRFINPEYITNVKKCGN